MLVLALISACTPPPERPSAGPSDDTPATPQMEEASWSGTSADEGFGTRVAFAQRRAVVTAPFGERVYVDGEAAAFGVAGGREETGDLLGAGLAVRADGVVLLGAPGAGELRTLDGEVLATGPSLGGVVAADGAKWVVSTPTGARTSDGRRFEWGARPDALLLEGDTVIAGFTRGDVALRVGDLAVARPAAQDEAGAALLRDGDTLYVGAPGAGIVYRLAGDALVEVSRGSGRYGAALAASSPGEVYVGAPMYGDDVEGAVFRLGDGTPRWEGDEGDQLGFALAGAEGALLIGAPGSAQSPGSARIVIAAP